MRRPAVYSAILHVVIFILLTVNLYNPFRRNLAEQKPVMIEFVNIADISTAPILTPEEMRDPEPQVEPQPEKEQTPEPPKPAPEAKPEVKPETAAPKPEAKPQEQPAPEPEALPIPAEKPKEPKKVEELKPEPNKEEAQEKPKKDDKPKPEKAEVNLDKVEDKPKPKEIDPKAKKKINDDFASLLKETSAKVDKDKTKSPGRVKGAPAERVGDTVTGTELDALKAHMRRCWIIPNGVRDAKNMSVVVTMNVGKDGVVKDAKIRDTHRLSDPVFRAAAESARRAALDPKCNPLPLPPAKYEQWKELEFDFNPKGMY